MLQPKVNPPQQTSSASIKIRQQGLTLRLKFFIFPPQQHRKRIINKIHVQLQLPFSQPSLQPSLNIPLNILSPPFAENIRLVNLTFKVYFTIWNWQKLCYSKMRKLTCFCVQQFASMLADACLQHVLRNLALATCACKGKSIVALQTANKFQKQCKRFCVGTSAPKLQTDFLQAFLFACEKNRLR